MSVILNGNTYELADFVGADGRGYTNINPDTGPADLDDVTDEVVSRFINGRASPEELAQLQRGHVSAYKSAETESAARESHQ